jgi:pilus assembly protein FimV
MSRHRYALPSAPSGFKVKPWIGALVVALACPAAAQAAVLGHSRLASALGQPLRIDIQVSQLSPEELNTLTAKPAAAADWAAAGLTPPVDLSSLHVSIIDGYASGSRVIRVQSAQAFDGPLADLLLDVGSASGSQRYQVSLLTQGGAAPSVAASPSAAGRSGPGAGATAGAASAQPRSIKVRRGDTMFSIAGQHAVKGVTLYQMMMALQRANPQAFIDGNINLVKAGASLSMPGMDELTALSDREARRQFMAQAQAFAAYRQRAASSAGEVGDSSATSSGAVTAGGEGPAQDATGQGRDQLRLSGNGGAGNADAADKEAALRANIGESAERVSQLEENVKHLNEALQAQGGAASNLVVEGARTLTDTLAAAAGAGTTDADTTGAGAAGQAGTAAHAAPEGSQQDARQSASGSGNASGAASGAAAQQGTASGDRNGASQASPRSEQERGGAAAPGGQNNADKGIQSGSGAASSGGGAGTQPGAQASSPGASPDSGAQAGAADTDSTKAGQAVSWFQEHTLGVITGVLALIVLIIAWLLRRANASRGDGRDGVITEAMVQEKLNEINLDLGDGPGDKTR